MNNKTATNKQRKLVGSLKGIGDILVYETRRQEIELVLKGLGKIRNALERIFEIQIKDPLKFEKLIASPEFHELYRKDEKEAQLRLVFKADDYMIGFSTPVNQIVRIYETAVDSQNKKVSRSAAHHLNWILASLSKRAGNGLFVEQTLGKIAEILRVAVKRGDGSMYSAAINWYINIVFDKDFDLSYLDLFDKNFFSTIRYIVSEEHTTLFKALVAALVEQIDIPTYYRDEIFNYGKLICSDDFSKYRQLNAELNIDQHTRELWGSAKDLDTKENLDKWIQKFEAFKKCLEPHFDPSQRGQAQELEKKIKGYVVSQFKYQNILEIVFAIGAYCLLPSKKRYSYIKYLWECKQPGDADAVWVGHNIIPTSPDELISFYFKKQLFDRAFDFWEGHHGSEKYYKEYFLLLLANLLKSIPPDSEGKYQQVVEYRLPDLHVHRLSDLIHSIGDLASLATELTQNNALLEELGLNTNNSHALFNEKVVPFLERLKQEANNQIIAKQKFQRISPAKVDEFKNDVLKGFYDSATIRDIFVKYFKAYEDHRCEAIDDKKVGCGNDRVSEKAAFFDEWHIHYTDWGRNYGRNIAAGESSHVLKVIESNCQSVSNSSFENILENFQTPGDIAIFSTNVDIWQYFENSQNFKSKWHGVEQLDIKSFAGWYEFRGMQIPIFKTYNKDADNQILILNRSKSGKLVQWTPLNKGDHSSLVKDIFYMDVQAFSENTQLMDDFIKGPPQWLKDIGDTEKQRTYLEACVRIIIFERFEYLIGDDFQGYKITLSEGSVG
ncbi:MAG: hypothetical protein A3B79_01765 [Deltaproteobacteria bacterium RIFCSPHIGHO2_02_FULL_50_15]|nr:MAG: hypothetical protein A3B79_01765 [Deltaproteobacteria bacterium RIFCSPHIGHO2_02_FULL_50_15]